MEQRIVFDGAMAVAVMDSADQTEPVALAPPPIVQGVTVERESSAQRSTVTEAAPPPAEPATEIAFVDAAVQDIETFLPGFSGEIIRLGSDSDGVAQIASVLASRSGVAAIHIVSHGEAGRLFLGTSAIDAQSMAGSHAASLAVIKSALAQQGDILLYGCDVAAGAAGQAFIEQLAAATEADVAASTDATGATALGGDWDLEADIGTIEAAPLDAGDWNGLLTQLSTDTWATTGTGNATVATATTNGITTTVSFGSFAATSGVGSFATTGTGATLNNIAVFSPAVQNTPSLGFVFTWDTTPGAGGTEASVDAATGVMTITFSEAVLNPVIHLDRIGGSGGSVQNGMRYTLVNPGGALSLTRLSGTSHFAVDTTANTIQNSQVDQATGTGYSAESSTTANLGTAAGSVRVNGTITSVSFLMSAAPNSNEGTGGDGVELKVSFEPRPVAVNDSFATPHNTPLAINVRSNDSEASNDALTVSAVNGTAVTAGGASVAVTGGSVALNADGNLVFTPTAGYVGATSFTYVVTDALGETATATVNGNVTEVVPVVDLNSGSTATERITNGGFTGDASGWTAAGATGTADATSYFWDGDGAAGTLTQSGLTGLNNGYGVFGAAQLTFGLGWNNGTPNTTVPATLDVSIGGVVYARFTTGRDGVNSTTGALTYLNGASGPATTVNASTYAAWTYSNLTIDLPANVAASGNLVFSFNAGSGGNDDIAIDNVSILTRTDTVAGNNFSTSYTENAAPVSIASASSDVRDNDDTTLVSATIVLSNAQTGDYLSVVGSLPAGITASAYDAGTGTITLSGTATAANYNLAIRAMSFASTSENPPTTARSINVTVNDGLQDSAVATTTIAVTAVNDAPVAGADSFSTNEDTPLTFNPSSNDTDAEGDTLTVTQVNGTAITVGGAGVSVTGGVVTLTAGGNLVFTPNLNYNGATNFTYTVADPSGATSMATVSGTVNPVNDAPLSAAPSAVSVAEDTTFAFSGGNSLSVSDVDTTPLTVTLTASNGTLTLGTLAGLSFTTGDGTADGTMSFTGSQADLNAALASLTFAPTADYHGSASLAFSTTDGTATVDRSVAITVTPVADIVNDNVNAAQGVPGVYNVLTGTNGASVDTFEDPARTVTAVTQGTNGSVSFAADGSITYVPNLLFVGVDSFTYTVTSGGVTETATVTVTVIANDPPVIMLPSAVSLGEDGLFAFVGLDAISVQDLDSALLTVTLSVANGTLSLVPPVGIDFTGGDGSGDTTMTFSGTPSNVANALATLNFTPSADYNGLTVLDLVLSDGLSTTTKSINVSVVSVADVADDVVSLAEDNLLSFNVLTGTNGASADNFESISISVVSVTQGGHGTVSFTSDGLMTYTPYPDYFGTDVFTYTVDSGGLLETATVTVNVAAVNDSPTSVVGVSASVDEDATLTFTAGNALSIADIDNSTLSVTLSVTNGTLSLGAISGLTFGSGDGVADSTMTFSGTSSDLNAALASLIFLPTADFNGSTSLSFDTTDGIVNISKVLAITVTPVADIVADSITTAEDTPATFNVLTGTNGAAADNFENPTRAVTSVTQGAFGSVTFDGSGVIVYTPAANYSGTDTFTYTVTVGTVTETTTVTMTVTAVNDAPVAADDSFSTAEDTAVVIDVRANDSDTEGDTFTVTQVNGNAVSAGGAGVAVTGGVVTLNAAGQLVFWPNTHFNGPSSFTYTVTDASGGSTTATVSGTVSAVNDTPVAADDSASIDEGAATSGNTLANDADVDGDTLAVSAVNGSALNLNTALAGSGGGLFTVQADGSYAFNPNGQFEDLGAGQTRVSFVDYTVSDGQGGSATARITVTVTGSNDAPVATADTFATVDTAGTPGGLPLTGTVLANDSDVDNAVLVVSQVNGSAGNVGTPFAGTFGTLTMNADGCFSYSVDRSNPVVLLLLRGQPALVETFAYTTSDGQGGTSITTLTIYINGTNDSPLAGNDANQIAQGEASASGNVISGERTSGAGVTTTVGSSADTDPNGDTLVVNEIRLPSQGSGAAVAPGTPGVRIGSYGTLTIDADGAYVYVLDNNNPTVQALTPGQSLSDSFVYTVTDGGSSIDATITVVIGGSNDAPVAGNDSFSTTEDNAATIAVRANDSDVDGDPLLVTEVNGQAISAGGAGVAVTGGVVTLTGAGLLVFTPTAHFNGATSFTYTVADPLGLTSTATVNGSVTPVNDVPVAAADSFSVAEDTAATIDVRANDVDVDGDTLTVTQVDGLPITAGGAGVAVPGGVVTLTTGGMLVFTPNLNVNGSTSFSYTVRDPSGATSTATVSGTITPVNDAPSAVADSFNTAEDSAATINVRANDRDIDGDALTVTQVNGSAITAGGAGVAVTGGVVTLTAGGNLVFTPNSNYNGATSFSYTVADPGGLTSTATVSGTVAPVNDTPVAAADSFSGSEDSPVTIDVRANDNDLDGDTLTVNQINGSAITAGGAAVAVTGGSVALNAGGNLVFTPAVNFSGAVSFSYTIADPSGATAGATVSGSMAAVNDAPVAAADSFSTAEDTPATIDVRANDSDLDGDALTVTQVNGSAITAGGAAVAVTGGSVTLTAGGTLVFTPAANFNGPASFNYTVADPSGATATASVSGTVTPVNDTPVANNDSFTTAEDSAATIDVRANDSDVDGDALSVTQVDGQAITAGGAGMAVTGGVVTLTAGGNLIFTPNANFNGATGFSYTVADPSGATATANVSGTVTPVNDMPVANNDSFTTTEDSAATIDVRANDNDLDGDALSVTEVNGSAITAGGPGIAVSGGTVTLTGAGQLVFTPTANVNGPTSFSYTVADARSVGGRREVPDHRRDAMIVDPA